MSTSTPENAAPNPLIVSGARWFWWIAGLSLVNSVLMHSGAGMNFVVGLGITALSDEMFAGDQVVGFAIDAVALAFFVLMGWQAQHGKLWAFYLGIAVYALDALVYVALQGWMAVAFHALALYYIGNGARILRAEVHGAG